MTRMAFGLLVVALTTAPFAHAATPALTPHLVLNEVQANPDGTDAGNEWVELYNPTASDVALDGWTLTDGETGIGGGADALDGLVVPAFGHLVVHVVEPRLANTGDDIALVGPDGAVVDRVAWGAGALPPAPSGASLARGFLVPAEAGGDAWYVEDAPSPGAANDARPLL